MKAWFAAALLVPLGCSSDDTQSSSASTTIASAASTGAGHGGMGGSMGAGGQGGQGGSADPCGSFSDELDNPATLSCWRQRHEEEGTPAQHDVLDIDRTVSGHLVLEPTSSGWFAEEVGPFVYKEVTGNFVVEVHAQALDENDPTAAASDAYHSAGMLVRDPASIAGAQDWLMYDVGFQETALGTETKTTVSSMSTLTLFDGGHAGRLRICRVGADFSMLRQLDGESGWTTEISYRRNDLPPTLQVGMITNAWPPGNGEARNLQARFDYIRLGSVASLEDCPRAIAPE